MAELDIENLTFRYEDMVMSFTLRVESGEMLAIIGPSGAGKSTLLSLIAGFDRPESGRVRIDGRDVTGLSPAARPVTTLFQDHNLFAHLDAAANVGLGIHPGLRLTAADRERVYHALKQVGLDGLERRLPGQLSGGERQRVALARSLVRNRPILLLDEPFAALGPALRREMLDLVDEMRKARGLTVLLVSHHPEDARYAAARTAFVHAGKILAVDETSRLLAGESAPELRAYLGELESGEAP
ncbi:thiamine ABC transporter ATP-binding protein [Rhodospirillaceae bacterium SYSU D60014]|uniref:thiamine ABC transporter ATP-binding protein n=1 Tax=Virgifigura deserti TaxID=2268457 RepID=UPI000E6763CB